MRRRLIITFWMAGVSLVTGGVWYLWNVGWAAIVLGVILAGNAMLAAKS